MDTFCTSQLSQLTTDLYSNTKKGDAAHAHIVESNYLSAAQYLLQPETSPLALTLEVITEVHLKATQQLMDTAGVLRHNRGARAGSEHFPSPGQVLPLLRTCIELFQSHLQDFFGKHSLGEMSELNDNVVRDACTLVGWLGYHFVKIHPFSDGNGRTVSQHCSVSIHRTLMFFICCAVPPFDELGIQALPFAAFSH